MSKRYESDTFRTRLYDYLTEVVNKNWPPS